MERGEPLGRTGDRVKRLLRCAGFKVITVRVLTLYKYYMNKKSSKVLKWLRGSVFFMSGYMMKKERKDYDYVLLTPSVVHAKTRLAGTFRLYFSFARR